MKSTPVKSRIILRDVVPGPKVNPSGAKATFAVLAMGIIEAIDLGFLDTDAAIRFFFHADNAQFVRHDIRNKLADEVMGRGLQLNDLFTVLEPALANRALRQELTKMRAALTTLLGRTKLAA